MTKADPSPRTLNRRHRVVVVGAGFGGLAVAKGLSDSPVDVVVVDANNHHTFQPLLYQVATAGLDAEDIGHPVRGIVAKHGNADVRLGRVVGIDLDARELRLNEGPPLSYDTLVLAAGAVTAHYDIPGVEEFGFGLKSIGDALALREHVLRQFERASVERSAIDDGALTVVIAGGGPTGVELAGGLTELFSRVLAKDFPTLDLRRARVVLVDPADRLLTSFPPESSATAAKTLAARGVEVRCGIGVASAARDAVTLTDGTVIPASTLAWTAGITASPLAAIVAEQLGEGALGRGGRIVVGDDLSVPGHPEVMVIGDIAAFTAPDGNLLPQLAPVAMQQGALAAANILATLEGRDRAAFRYHDRGSMATIGRNAAVANLPNGLRLSGFVGWLSWLLLHLVMLVGFRNRVNVLVNWMWSYLTYDRASRLILTEGSERHHTTNE